MLLFPLGYLQMESTKKIVYPGWNKIETKNLLPWMECASAIVVTVNFMVIYWARQKKIWPC